jgi:hypothetical protein
LIQLKIFPFVRKIKNIFARGHKIFFVYVVKIYRSVYFKKTPKKGFSGLSRAPYRAILFSISNKISKTTKTIAVREDCAGNGQPHDKTLNHLNILIYVFIAFFLSYFMFSCVLLVWSRRGVVKNPSRDPTRARIFHFPAARGQPDFWGPHTPV